jgi:RNA polymerase sigma-70 factor, ECF subfamily
LISPSLRRRYLESLAGLSAPATPERGRVGYGIGRRYLASLLGIRLPLHPSAADGRSGSTETRDLSGQQSSSHESRERTDVPTGAEGQGATEEAELVAQMAAGDVGAPVAELYRRYAQLLYRFGIRALGDSGSAEELVQETFVRLWRTAGRFDAHKGNVQAYLFVIARGVAVDLRRRDSSRLPPADELDLPQPDKVDQILDPLIVRGALDTLPSIYAEVLRLGLNEGLTQSQIAERLGLPLGTVKSRMFRGLQALRAAPTEQGYHKALESAVSVAADEPSPDLPIRTLTSVAEAAM